jgi:hypothetical protein
MSKAPLNSAIEMEKQGKVVQIVEPGGGRTMEDLEKGGYTILKVEEKHGVLHNAIPCMPLALAIICCIFNILVPGLGTLLSSFTVFCCGSTRLGPSPWKAFGYNIIAALLQMITFVIIVGWIWSILWGMTFVQLALAKRPKSSPPE